MIVDVVSAVTYARERANSYDEPITVYYIPYDNVYAFGKVGSLPVIQRLFAGKDVVKIVEIDPVSWQIDTEEEL
jgi:signal peptidase I